MAGQFAGGLVRARAAAQTGERSVEDVEALKSLLLFKSVINMCYSFTHNPCVEFSLSLQMF